MLQTSWKTLEEQVRGLAGWVYGKECRPGQISGVNFDGIIKIDDGEMVAIEVSKQNDLDKVRQGIARIALARQQMVAEAVVLRGYIVLTKTPTPSMLEAAQANKVAVMSVAQLATLFFEFPKYKTARLGSSFGSSIDPISGNIDKIEYVPVKYNRTDIDKDVTVEDIGNLLLSGKNIVLLGEYGSGKSRCVREIFAFLSQKAGSTFQFPFAVNLRECWGLDAGHEIVRRSMKILGLEDMSGSAVRAMNRNGLIFLLDGFDELGSQSWSTDENRLKQLRARALSGVKDLVQSSQLGSLVAGREHYFSSNEEMMSALGLSRSNTIVLKAKDEFTDEELSEYFEAAGLAVDLPSWLPKKPLICQTIALLTDDELGSMFGAKSEGVEFWNHFISIVCKRDARINTIFDESTIYRVFVSLSRITRRRPANIGPISQRDLQDAFEQVVGQLPVEEASAMLQRLPSLGRIGPESQDRQFIDMFILDGLRAKDVGSLAEVDEVQRRGVLSEKWLNPLEPLGQSILSVDMKSSADVFLQIADRASKTGNATLASDIVGSMARMDISVIDLEGITIHGGKFTELNLADTSLSNLTIDDSNIDHLVLPNSPPINVEITNSVATRVSGAASFSGLPGWVQLGIVDSFDTVQTVAQIRKVGLSPAHEILVGVLKKTFKQKGAGRKEEALLRGFGGGASKKLANAVLSLLMRENILGRHKGDEGWVYSPSRSETPRISAMLDQLRSSTDPLWKSIDDLNSDK